MDEWSTLWVGFFEVQPQALLEGAVWRALCKTGVQAVSAARSNNTQAPQWALDVATAERGAVDERASLLLVADVSVFCEVFALREYMHLLLRCAPGLATSARTTLRTALRATSQTEFVTTSPQLFLSQLCGTDVTFDPYREYASQHARTKPNRDGNTFEQRAGQIANGGDSGVGVSALQIPPCITSNPLTNPCAIRLCRTLRDLTRTAPIEGRELDFTELFGLPGYTPFGLRGVEAGAGGLVEFVTECLGEMFCDVDGGMEWEIGAVLVLVTRAARESVLVSAERLAGVVLAAGVVVAKMCGGPEVDVLRRGAKWCGHVQAHHLELSLLLCLDFDASTPTTEVDRCVKHIFAPSSPRSSVASGSRQQSATSPRSETSAPHCRPGTPPTPYPSAVPAITLTTSDFKVHYPERSGEMEGGGGGGGGVTSDEEEPIPTVSSSSDVYG